MSEAFDKRMTEWKDQIDDCLRSIIDDSKYPEDFKDVLRYSMFPGGKRLRPILFLEWHNLFAPPNRQALIFACAIEIIHAFSLIHDDMPCMDNDDIRRGKPTVHKEFGEGKALLAGDALLTLAFECLASSLDEKQYPLVFTMARLVGSRGIINGQYLDLYAKCESVSDLIEIYKKKTGALITLACAAGYLFPQMSGALNIESEGLLCGIDNEYYDIEAQRGWHYIGADSSETEELVLGAAAFGSSFGIAFQLYDDLSEYLSCEQPDGASILDFVSLDEAKMMLNGYLNEAVAVLDRNYHGDTSVLREFAEKFVIL